MSENRYVVEKIGRINLRYYLIKIQGEKYIIDYSNPRKLRNYFYSFEFVRNKDEWEIYKLKDQNSKIRVWPKSIYTTITRIYIFLIFYPIITGWFLPRSINIVKLSYDERITANFKMVLFIMMLGAICIGFVLNFLNKISHFEFEFSKESILQKEKIPKKHRLWSLMKNIGANIVLYSMFILLGFGGSNYVNLIVFGFIGVYMFVFTKFLDINLDGKFEILGEEQKE